MCSTVDCTTSMVGDVKKTVQLVHCLCCAIKLML